MASQSLRVLIANVTLAGRTGTEIVTRDVALGLRAAGHEPMVYAPALGALADELRAAGIPVVSRLAELSAPPDIVHGHHHVQTMNALLHFPEARGLFVCHDRTAAASAPPRLDRIGWYVAVDRNCLERLVADYAIPEGRVRVILNAVDMRRVLPRPPLPAQPMRAAIFSNYATDGTHLESVREACARLQLPLDVIGAGVGRSSDVPERDLAVYDIVFAKGRCALEALAVGTAVVLCDTAGLGPMVTSAELGTLRAWNLGRRLLRAPLTVDGILREVARYDAPDAALVHAAVRDQATLDAAIAQYLEVYDDLQRSAGSPPRSFEADLTEYLQHTSDRIGALERDVDAHRGATRMDALDDEACGRITLEVVARSAAMPPGAIVQVRVAVTNGSATLIGSYPPFPLNLSYRWFEADTGAAVVPEGARTALAPAIAPGDTATCLMRMTAPTTPGRYCLRITLVQEGLRWLDQIERPVAVDVGITVLASEDAATTPA